MNFFALFKRVLCICKGFYFTNENLNKMSLDEWVVNEGWANFVFECMRSFSHELDNIYHNID